MEKVVKEVASGDSEIEIDKNELQSAVRDAVRDSVKKAVQEMIAEVMNGKEPVKR
jgi:hypothetical protein